jgi:hypothetical protein
LPDAYDRPHAAGAGVKKTRYLIGIQRLQLPADVPPCPDGAAVPRIDVHVRKASSSEANFLQRLALVIVEERLGAST